MLCYAQTSSPLVRIQDSESELQIGKLFRSRCSVQIEITSIEDKIIVMKIMNKIQ